MMNKLHSPPQEAQDLMGETCINNQGAVRNVLKEVGECLTFSEGRALREAPQGSWGLNNVEFTK